MIRLLVCLALSLVAVAASATPERRVVVRDTPFAIASDRLFVLRRTVDNLGLHQFSREDVKLVMILLDGSAQYGFGLHSQHVEIVHDTARDRYYRAFEGDRTNAAFNPFAFAAVYGGGLIDPHVSSSGMQKDAGDQARSFLQQALADLATSEQPVSQAGSGPHNGSFYRTLDKQAERCVEQDENYPIALEEHTVQLVRVTCFAYGDEVSLSLVMPRLGEDK